MADRRSRSVSSRKQPQQARSSGLVAAILDAAVQVLAKEGAQRFTTARVAERAGVSVGSLYQYFPNKEALLFRLQLDEWEATGQLLAGCFGERDRPPVERLRRAIVEFFRTEAEEAALRRALDDASALYRGSDEARAQRGKVLQLAETFFREALPRRAPSEVAFAAEFFMLSMGAIAEKVTEYGLDRDALLRWTHATADLLCAHLERLQQPRAQARPRPTTAGRA